ncbi:MAG: RagB/SusD family nutrient uptake outer membrane protein, partial [Chitinophagia bacterium]|nr:RagB/SusD family nutrient uptake outer membrane protein [Chitinophagia bacterium]
MKTAFCQVGRSFHFCSGLNGSNNANSAHVDIDFPMFRLADVYLMLAESSFRLGDQATALQYVNLIRTRAYNTSAFNVASLSLDDILDERARELSWEATRRTDLIRFGKFTGGDYVWSFKGG